MPFLLSLFSFCVHIFLLHLLCLHLLLHFSITPSPSLLIFLLLTYFAFRRLLSFILSNLIFLAHPNIPHPPSSSSPTLIFLALPHLPHPPSSSSSIFILLLCRHPSPVFFFPFYHFLSPPPSLFHSFHFLPIFFLIPYLHYHPFTSFLSSSSSFSYLPSSSSPPWEDMPADMTGDTSGQGASRAVIIFCHSCCFFFSGFACGFVLPFTWKAKLNRNILSLFPAILALRKFQKTHTHTKASYTRTLKVGLFFLIM